MNDATSPRDDDTRPLGDELFADPDHGTAAPEPDDGTPTTVLDVGPQPGPRPGPPDDPAPSPSLPSPQPDPSPQAGPSPVPATVTAPAPRRGPRISTIVWGFVIAAFGAVVLASAFGAHVDTGLVAILVLAVAGVTLVVGSIVSGARRRRG